MSARGDVQAYILRRRMSSAGGTDGRVDLSDFWRCRSSTRVCGETW